MINFNKIYLMETFNLFYETKEKKEIKIFNDSFVKNNKRKCKMIIDGKLLSLRKSYRVQNKNLQILK